MAGFTSSLYNIKYTYNRIYVYTSNNPLYEADVDKGPQQTDRHGDSDSCPVLFDAFPDYRSKASYAVQRIVER